MTRTLGLGLALGACLLQLATLISASPVQPIKEIKDVARRDTTDTTTVWIDPTTVTVNPRDPTITREAGWTTTTGPPPFISTVTSSCITYNYSYPAGHETTTTTTTVFRQSTVTVTDTNRPTETQYFFHTPTVTVTTPLATYVSYHCLNTLVVQYADWEYLTWTWSQWEHVASTTGLCLTTSTRSTTIPGFTLPASSTRTLEDWEYFSVPGVSVVTKNTVAIATDVTSVIPGTSTRTVCDSRNLRPTTTTTITVTRQATTTRTVTGGGPGCVTRAPSRRDVEAAAVVGTPVEVHTVVYTTVTVIDNSVYTLTGTAVVDVNTAEFPVTRIAYSTVTGPGATVTATVCR